MWLGDEFEAAGLEVAAPGWRSDPGPAPEPETPVLQLSDAEIEQLAATEGWDRAEVDAIRDLIGRPAGEGVPEADAETPALSEPEAPAEAGPTARRRPGPGVAERIPWVPQGGSAASPASDPDWLRGRRGPAADAYRRLRRLFQG